MIDEARAARWRRAALLFSALTVGLGLATARHAQGERPTREPARSERGLSAATSAALSDEPRQTARDDPEGQALTLLAELARESGPRTRLELVTALGEAGDEAALDALAELVAHAERPLAQAALLAIAKIGGARAGELLRRRFAESRELELPDAAAALATLGGKEAREFLVRAARSKQGGAREAALGALVTLDTADVRELMLSELRAGGPSAAVEYFADCVEPRALPALEQMARSAEPELAKQAVAALVAQGPSAHATLGALLRVDAETANAVLESAKNVLELRPLLRAVSIEQLRAGAITSGAVFDYLAQDLSQAALSALVEAARDGGSSASAINALAERGDPASLAALTLLSRDSDAGVAATALCAQFRKPDSRARATLLAASRDGTRIAAEAALASIDAPEAEQLLDTLRTSSEAHERLQAARLLGSFGSRDAERYLDALARDSDSRVVDASLLALAQLGARATLRSLATQQSLSEPAREYAAELLRR